MHNNDPWEDDSPWGDNEKMVQDSEWSKISSDFRNAGYREGITAGKEAHLQEGFDQGFAQTGVPLGREIGILRGTASVLLSFLTSTSSLSDLITAENRNSLTDEARAIISELSQIRFSDIVPPDLEAERHAREHLESADDPDYDANVDPGDEAGQKRQMESLEDMMSRMGAGGSSAESKAGRPTIEDVTKLSHRLRALAETLGVPLLLPVR